MNKISRNMKQKLHPVWAAASCPTQIIKYNIMMKKCLKIWSIFFKYENISHPVWAEAAWTKNYKNIFDICIVHCLNQRLDVFQWLVSN